MFLLFNIKSLYNKDLNLELCGLYDPFCVFEKN